MVLPGYGNTSRIERLSDINLSTKHRSAEWRPRLNVTPGFIVTSGVRDADIILRYALEAVA